MKQRFSGVFEAMLVLWLVAAVSCTGDAQSSDTWATNEDFDEATFWHRFPRPSDAAAIPVGEGFDTGLRTGMIEPELFDFYAAWLRCEGWQRQAPTEAVVGLPHQAWQKETLDLLIEIRGLDEQGNTVVWFQLKER